MIKINNKKINEKYEKTNKEEKIIKKTIKLNNEKPIIEKQAVQNEIPNNIEEKVVENNIENSKIKDTPVNEPVPNPVFLNVKENQEKSQTNKEEKNIEYVEDEYSDIEILEL